ncbi:MAG: mannonate dehydratase [Ostreibacterium sp.]
MIESWRWFGPTDSVSLDDIRQTGVNTIVTALHEIPNGDIWPVEAIQARQREIATANLTWDVVESLPIHESIKTRQGNYKTYLENYRQTLVNLGKCGIKTVCYNFMPVLDWTRTDLDYELPDGCKTLYFNHLDFAAFELFMLKRDGASEEYTAEEVQQAEIRFKKLSKSQKEKLQANIIKGLPGAEEHYTLKQFREQLATYQDINSDTLREHLREFLLMVLPVAQAAGIRLVIHPDDPPRPILGLPRIVSTLSDMNAIRAIADVPENGFTFCTGSYGVRADNALEKMIDMHIDRIHFVHLRATKRLSDDPKSFYEANHLGGDIDIYAILTRFLAETQRRTSDNLIYFRPDHGYQMIDDLRKTGINPGYSCIGRLKGLAELRGMIYAMQAGAR